AYCLCHAAYAVKPGDTCLVHGAAGGVAGLLCQLIKMCGARVIGTVSTEAKAAAAKVFGADDIIFYREVDFEPHLMRLTNNKGVNVVFDGVGEETFERSLKCLAPLGTLVMFGSSSGPVTSFDPRKLNRGSQCLTLAMLPHYLSAVPENFGKFGNEVLR